MYDQRSKAQCDYEWGLASAREEGHAAGHKEGLKQGESKGREAGVIIGKIQILEELLGEPVVQPTELGLLSIQELESKLERLQQRMRDRQV